MTDAASILGLGHYVPERVLTNTDLERMVDTSDEWITSRTGIRERRMAEPGQTCSDLALAAGEKALAAAGMRPEDLTHIIVATFTPDAYIPSTGCVLQHRLGAVNSVAFDLAAACSGFLYSLENARGILALHPDAKVLVVASEVVTSRVNFKDRSTCVLFGDGAGAVVVGRPGKDQKALAGIRDVLLKSDGSVSDLLTVRGGGSSRPPLLGHPVDEDYFVAMQGSEVFKHAVRNMYAVSVSLLERNGLGKEHIDLFIPHQANGRIVDALSRKLAFPGERIFVNLDLYGNTSAASIPLALSEAYAQGRITPGDRVLLTTFGGGFTWGSGLLEF